MERLQQLEAALIKADAAGNADDAMAIASEIRRLRASQKVEEPRADKPKGARLGAIAPYAGVRILTDAETGQGITSSEAGKAIAGMGVRAAGPAIGQAIGATLGPKGAAIGGGIGGLGGEVLAQAMEGEFRPGAMAASVPMGMLPMGAGGAVRPMLRDAAANLAAVNMESVIDNGELVGLGQGAAALVGGGISGRMAAGAAPTEANAAEIARYSSAEGARRRAAAQSLIRAGGVLPRSEIVDDPGLGTVMIESVAGVGKLRPQMVQRNNAAVRSFLRKDLGLTGDEIITPELLTAIRSREGKSYEAIAATSQQARTDVELLVSVRNDLYDARATVRSKDATPAERNAARAKIEEIEPQWQRLEAMMDVHAASTSNPRIIDSLALRDQHMSEAAAFKAKFDAMEAERIQKSPLPNDKPADIGSFLNRPDFEVTPDERDALDRFHDAYKADLAKSWQTAKRRAQSIDRRLLQQYGGTDHPMAAARRKSEQVIAKTYDIERFGSPDTTGQIDIAGLARNTDSRRATGGMLTAKKIGDQFPQYTADPARLNRMAGSRLDGYYAMASGAGAVENAAQGQTAPMLARAANAMFPALGRMARERVMSRPYQRASLMMMNTAPAPDNRYSLLESFMRQAALQNTR